MEKPIEPEDARAEDAGPKVVLAVEADKVLTIRTTDDGGCVVSFGDEASGSVSCIAESRRVALEFAGLFLLSDQHPYEVVKAVALGRAKARVRASAKATE